LIYKDAAAAAAADGDHGKREEEAGDAVAKATGEHEEAGDRVARALAAEPDEPPAKKQKI